MTDSNQNPTRGGLVPMIATPGGPTRADIRAALERYKSAGINQFLFIGRAGCAYPYLSEKWMEMCADFIECAAERDMQVWIYDDYNCPTTYVNGALPAQGPEFQAKVIEAWLEDDAADIDGAPAAAAGAAPGDSGGTFRYHHRTNPKAGDIMNEAAIDWFLESTYEAYAARFGQYFGNTIRGFFSDEPTQAFLPLKPTWDNRVAVAAYTGIEADYAAHTGRTLTEDLEAFLRDNRANAFWSDYWHLIGRRTRAYLDRLSDWCQRHNLLLTGHLYDEHTSYDAVFKNCDPMHVIQGFTLPGMDEIFTETSVARAEWVTLSLAESAIRQRGIGGIAELLSLGPCDMPAARMRQMLWLTALFVVDHYMIAAAQLNAGGNSTRGAFFGLVNLVQPDFALHGHLARDARHATAIAHLNPIPQVDVHFPQQLASRKAFHNRAWPVYDSFCELRTLLVQLAAHQISWRLIAEDAPGVSGTPAIRITDQGYILGGKAHSLADLLPILVQTIDRAAIVTDDTGRACRDVFVRTYQGGTTAVLDLRQDQNPALRQLHLGSQVRPFLQNGQSIALFTELEPGTWQIAYDQANLLRCNFAPDSRAFTFRCGPNLRQCRLVIRQQGDIPAVQLDGQPILATEPCTTLPQGFAQWYRQTAPLDLAAGDHTLSLTGDSAEYPYLPGVFIAGEMTVEEGNSTESDLPAFTLHAGMPDFHYGPLQKHGLPNYVGQITLTRTIRLPQSEGTTLCLQPLAHLTTVSLNDQPLGERAWAPYEWPLPSTLLGQTVTLRIILASSFGAMFGDLETYPGITMNYLARQKPGAHSSLGLAAAPYFRWQG